MLQWPERRALLQPVVHCISGDRAIPFLYGNIPEELWGRLKAWAKIKAHVDEPPTLADCAAWVENVCTNITGRAGVLPPDQVAFYAAETVAMIARFREEMRAEALVDGTN